jgi:2',3'-cyclic-nucleotide 2'-phosphodiesterase (5'-nucleotidase family)
MLHALLTLALASPSVQDSAHIVVIATTDVHGHATAWDFVHDRAFPGGLARAARAVDSLRQSYPGQVVLVDAGDLLQGDPFSAYFAQVAPRDPHPVVDVMNQLAYDAATPGNHDFNFGLPLLRRAISGAAFAYVSANVFALPGDAPMFTPQIVIMRQGVRVGITGFTTPGVMVWDRANMRGVGRVGPVGASAPRALSRLRQEADVAIVLIHSGMDGASSYDTAGIGPENVAATLATGPVRPDLVVVGHSHRQMRDSVLNGVHFIQPRYHAQSLAVAHVDLARNGAAWRVTRVRADQIELAGTEPAPGRLRRLDEAQADVRLWVATPLAGAAAPMPAQLARAGATPLIGWINDVQRRKARADLASTAVFDVRSGFEQGEIRLADVAGVYPYENTLRAIRITGSQLRGYLEQSAKYFTVDAAGNVGTNPSIPGSNFDIVSGATYVVDLSRPAGNRIRDLAVKGRFVGPLDTYTLALDSYRQGGGGGYTMLQSAPVVYDRNEGVRELLVDDLKRRGVLDPADFDSVNWRIEPAAMATATRQLFLPPPPVPRDSILLRILSINDFHGALESRTYSWSDGRPVGGAAALKATMDTLAARCRCTTLRVDAGDEMQGTLLSNLSYGRTTIEALNRVGIQIAAIGNHEFDWSTDTLRNRMADARYPWVAANIFDSATGVRPGWAVPWQLVQAGSNRVAVVGYITSETGRIVAKEHISGLRFGVGAASILDAIEAARAERPDFTIVLTHSGGRCDSTRCAGEVLDLARELPPGAVDAIVSGHSHTLLDTEAGGIPIVQARSNGTAVGIVDIIRAADGTRRANVEVETVWADRVAPDRELTTMVDRWRRESDSLTQRVVAQVSLPLLRQGNQYGLGFLIADAFRNVLRADAALVNNGGIRADVSDGPLTYGALFSVMPFQNDVVLVTLKGRELKAALEQALSGDGEPDAHIAGLRVRYDPRRPAGKRIREVRLLDGSRLKDGREYTLATSDYLASGQDGYTALERAARERSMYKDIDAVVLYLRRVPQPVHAPVDARFLPGRQ